MTITAILLAGLIIFAAHVVAGVTGFGSNIFGLPLLALVVGLDAGKQSLIVLSTLLYVYLLIRWHEHVDWRQLIVMLALAAMGVPLGMIFFGALPQRASMVIVGVFVAGVGMKSLVNLKTNGAEPSPRPSPGVPGEGEERTWLPKLLVVAGGFVHGAFTIGGPLLIVYAKRAIPDKSVFRATLAVLWILLNIPMIATWSVRHTWSPATLRVTLFGLPFFAGGLIVGEMLHHRVKESSFRAAVDGSLIAIGLLLSITALTS